LAQSNLLGGLPQARSFEIPTFFTLGKGCAYLFVHCPYQRSHEILKSYVVAPPPYPPKHGYIHTTTKRQPFRPPPSLSVATIVRALLIHLSDEHERELDRRTDELRARTIRQIQVALAE
jgi:hypothetical protein